MSRRLIIVYPEKGEKYVAYDKINGVTVTNNEDALRPVGGCDPSKFDYHQRIRRTYHELECAGKLNDMSPRQKQRINDVHMRAQDPAYWKD